MNNKTDKIRSGYFLSSLSVLVFLAVWEIVGRLEIINPIFISYPSEVFAAGFELVKSGKIIPHFIASVKALLAGLFLAVAAGGPGGLILGTNKNLYDFFRPFVFTLNALPKVAAVPLIIIWFGFGIVSKIAVVFLMALPSILINSLDAAKNIDKEFLEMAKSFKAGRLFVLKSITFFGSLPFVFSGIRVAIGKAVIGLVIAEVFGYGIGLGYLAVFYGQNFQTGRLMFVILLLLSITLALSGLLAVLERLVIKWKA